MLNEEICKLRNKLNESIVTGKDYSIIYQLSIELDELIAEYYRRNRKDLYTKTITRENLQGAFVSWEKFEQYISAITTSLYSGNYIDEFELIGRLEKLTGTTCPKALSDTKDKEIRFTGSVEAKDMSKVVIEFINK